MRNFIVVIWKLISSNAITTRQTSNKFGLLSLLWQFCSSYLYLVRRTDYLMTNDNGNKQRFFRQAL